MAAKISFGTDGWRGVLARDFTFENVELVARAVAEYLHGHGLAGRGVVVGFDTRFLSDRFAAAAGEVFASCGIPVYLVGRPTPTPVTAFAIKEYGTGGAVMLTASHNPPEYNGFKFIPEYAGPALPHITREIEEHIRRLAELPAALPAAGESSAPRREVDPRPAYFRHVRRLVDLEAVRREALAVVVDPMYGAGTGYLEEILAGEGAEVTAVHNHRDPLFGGGLPEPTAKTLGELRRLVLERGAAVGLALDGDADRFGLIDRDGSFIAPNEFLPLLYYHLLEYRGERGPVARTVATTHLLDRLAEAYGQEAYETPVGFKYIGQHLLEKGCLLGGEESGGLSVRGHIPEKDGILAGLLAAEMVAARKKSLRELLEELWSRFGRLYSRRLDVHTTPQEKERVLGKLRDFAPRELAGKKVLRRLDVDGVKLLLDGGSWVLVRPSGTEPLFRLYAEAGSEEELRAVQEAAREALGL
ncbi:phosphoglucomutase/phosphomannomutase family protein [Desulfovirgula thermocuniculi]|uniref:phosphoglucomutase/phosphomannomutase family protein n=1 Tax=Desulfovirgula thermocuniculi TaxID=348842 RepID=UPI0004262A02|nr:phosphoglucomutase/phosphomannomutase family protein [Desulfovirgula thermocuniculi]